MGCATAELCPAVVERVMRNAAFKSKINPENTET
jgi:hypothetical protein